MTLFKPALLALTLAALSLTAAPAASGSAGMLPAERAPTARTSVMPASYDWTGAYAGLQLGHIDGHQGWTFPSIDLLNSGDPRGYIAGAFAGYNWQAGPRLVFGVEASANAARASYLRDMFRTNRDRIPGIRSRGLSEVGRTASLRFRVGVPFDRTLAYAALGLANTDLRLTWLEDGVVRDRVSQNRTGGLMALGVEQAIGERWRLRAEVNYADFGTRRLPAQPGGTPASNSRLIQIGAQLGLAYRF